MSPTACDRVVLRLAGARAVVEIGKHHADDRGNQRPVLCLRRALPEPAGKNGLPMKYTVDIRGGENKHFYSRKIDVFDIFRCIRSEVV